MIPAMVSRVGVLRSSTFDPLNPPGGSPVAAWLASAIPGADTDPIEGGWNPSVGGWAFPFDGGALFPSLAVVGGKKRVRCPAASQVASYTDPTFSVPSGACSIVLVFAPLNGIESANNHTILGGDNSDFVTTVTQASTSIGDTLIIENSGVINEPAVLILTKGAGDWSGYVNGENLTDPGVSSNDWVGPLTIGDTLNGSYPDHDIVAILIFDRALSPTEIADYTTWGIAEAGSV